MIATPRLLPLALGGLLALAAAMGIGRFVYTPILPAMAEALALTQGQAGLIAAANFAGYLAGALLAATPWLRGSRRRWLLGGLLVSAVSTGAMAGSSLLGLLALWRFVGGVASALVLVFASALVLDRLYRAGQARLAAVHFAGVGAGIVLSALLIAGLQAAGFDWRVLWLASGLAALLAWGGVVRLVPEQAEPPPVAKSAATAQSGRALPALVAAYGLFGFGYVITATFLVAIVRASAEVRALEPLVWLVVGLAALPSVGLWTRLGARLGILRAFALACGVEALGIAASVLWLTPAGLLLAAALWGGTFMGITALGLMGARQLAHGDPRRTLALMTAAFGLGQMIGPAFAGLVHDVTGSFLVPSLCAAGALVVGAGLVGMRRER